MAVGANYRTIWRWHFYAGLFVLPFVLILSVTGAIYLFKPQIDRWEERDYRSLGVAGMVSPERQVGAALAAYPSARFNHVRLPEQPDDAVMVQLALPGGALREVFVAPQGNVVGTLAEQPAAVRSRVVRLAALAAGSPGSELFHVHVTALLALVSGDVRGQVQLPGHVTAFRDGTHLRFRTT